MSALRILVVEDEGLVATGLRAQLKALGHQVVGLARDGEEAVAMAAALAPDLILMDIRLPKLDGLEAARRILQQRRVPIIFISAYSEADLAQEASASGGFAVVVALGCFLYSYQPDEIANLAPDLFSLHHCRSIKRQLALQLQARFQHAHIMRGEDQALCTRPPTEHERQLVHHALTMFTPWECPRISTPIPDRSIWHTHLDGVSAASDWAQIHALIDPTCALLARLIPKYNESFPTRAHCASRSRTTC